jgi:hypothetical protein
MPYKKKHLFCFVMLTLLVTSSAFGDDTQKPCHLHPQVVGACFPVHGRLSLYNGTPSVRLWKIGTNRMLGVSQGRFALSGYQNLPETLEQKLSWENELYGDFVVCPFTPAKPGVMQLICIDSGAHLVVKERGK